MRAERALAGRCHFGGLDLLAIGLGYAFSPPTVRAYPQIQGHACPNSTSLPQTSHSSTCQ